MNLNNPQNEEIRTRADLKELQELSLESKINITKTNIIEWYQHFDGNVYISFSGGKDSTVLLHQVRELYPEVPAVYCDTGLEYPEIREFVKTIDNVVWIKPKMNFRKVINTYGYPVISKEVSHIVELGAKGSESSLARLNNTRISKKTGRVSEFNIPKYRYLLDAPFKISDKCCYWLKKAPFTNYGNETKRKPFVGTMASESQLRTQNWLKSGCNAFEGKEPKSTPMSFWTEQDVLQYLLDKNLPYASVYGNIVLCPERERGRERERERERLRTTGVERTGCMFCMFGVHLEKEPNRLQKLQETHPKQYDYCINSLGCGKVLDYINVPYTRKEDEE